MIIFLYLVAFIFAVILPLIILFYLYGDFIANFMGAPFVPTSTADVDEILREGKLKKGQNFVELGSGDGRVVMMAVSKYGVLGTGIEIHPLLVLYSKIRTKIRKLKNISFRIENFYNTDLRKADIVFVYLFPKTVKKLKEKFIKECKNNTLIISHGFRIEGFEKFLDKTIERKIYSTYFYRLKK